LRDRYLFYLAPLLLVALARALRDEISVYAVASVVVFVAVTVFAHDFRELPGVHVDSPAAVLAGPIHDSGGPFLIAVASVVFAVFVKWTPPRARVVGAALVVFLTTGLTSATAWSRLLTSHSPSGRPVVGQRGLVLDWVDRVLPADAHVALIAYSSSENWGSNAILWWDVEFWNRTVDRSFVIDETWEYAPFPNEQLEIDEESGRVRSSSQPRFMIAAQDDARLRLVGARVGQNYGLDILEPERPYRADWITKELYPDGSMRSGTPATIRVFATPGSQDPERVHVEVVLRAPSQRPVGFRVGNGAARRMAGGEVVKVGRNLCIEPRSHAELQLVSTKGARIVGVPIGPTVTTSRAVGPRVRAVGVSRTGERC